MGLTEDLGAGGCRIVSRLALRPGEPLSLKLRYGGVDFALDVVGTVAWTAPRPPWRTGVAFARGQEDKARRFVRAVLAAAPDLTTGARTEVLRASPPPRPTPAPVPRGSLPAAPSPVGQVQALITSARSQAATGDLAGAIRSLLAALELDPGNAEALEGLRVLRPANA